MATLQDLRVGLAANLASVAGVTVYSDTISNPTPPFLWVRPPAGEQVAAFHQTFGGSGLTNWTLIVEGVVGDNNAAAAQADFATLLSGIPSAVEADKTLGGIAQDCNVTELRNYVESSTPEGPTIVGAEWVVAITV